MCVLVVVIGNGSGNLVPVLKSGITGKSGEWSCRAVDGAAAASGTGGATKLAMKSKLNKPVGLYG